MSKWKTRFKEQFPKWSEMGGIGKPLESFIDSEIKAQRQEIIEEIREWQYGRTITKKGLNDLLERLEKTHA